MYTITTVERPAIVKVTDNPIKSLDQFHDSHTVMITDLDTNEVMSKEEFTLKYYADLGDTDAKAELAKLETRQKVESEVTKQIESLENIDDEQLDKALGVTKKTTKSKK